MKRYITILVLAATLIVLSACQLAREGTAQEEAWMVGVFVTTEHLDLIGSLEGQIAPMRRGRPDFSALFQPGRLYAQWDETIGDFRFPDVEGIALFSAASPHTENEIFISHVGGSISDGHTNVYFGDNEKRVEMEGTIYIVPGSAAMSIIHMNPVFQTADGSVFLTTGNSFSGHGLGVEGRVFSTSMSETRTVTENGVENTNSTSVTLNVASMFAPTKIVLLQMDEYSRVVMRTEFAPGEVPQALHMESETAYAIVETHRDSQHDPIVRELVQKAWHEQRISTFVAGEDGVLGKTWTEIIWP